MWNTLIFVQHLNSSRRVHGEIELFDMYKVKLARVVEGN